MALVSTIFKKMDYGPAEENFDAAKAFLKTDHLGPYIQGDFRENDEEVQNITNPSTGEILATIKPSSKADIEDAINSCLTQYAIWENLDRATLISNSLHKVVKLLERDINLFAHIEALTRGLQVKHTREIEVPTMIKYFTYFANCAYMGSFNSTVKSHHVVACILTEDAPLMALAMLLAPAFAAYSCVCLVVPTEISLSSILLARICFEASGSAMLLNILPGNQTTMEQVVTDKDVSKVLYFGPTSIARHLRQKVAGCGKDLAALMSGKTSMLVFDSADLSTAVDTAVQTACFNHGALPWAVKVLLVQESIFLDFVGMMKTRMRSLRVGTAGDKLADVGRTHNKNVVNLVAKAVSRADENGIEVFQVLENVLVQDFFPLTLVIGGHTECNRLVNDEDSVPIITIIPFRTPQEAVDLANNSRYGFAASVWCESISLSLSVADKLQCGTVWINSHGVMDPAVPFGGWKESGLGSFGGIKEQKYLMKCDAVFKEKSGEVVLPSPVTLCNRMALPRYQLFYGGSYKNAEGDRTTVCYFGAQPYAYIADASSKDVRKAVGAAAPAQALWAAAGCASRTKTLHKMAFSVASNIDEIESHNTCVRRPNISETLNSVVEMMKFNVAKCAAIMGSIIQPHLPKTFVSVTNEPLGIIAFGINCCGMKFMSPLLDALCHGNAVILVLDNPLPTPELHLLNTFVRDAPSGLISVLTGKIDILLGCLAKHQDVNAVWTLGCNASTVKDVEMSCSQDMKYLGSCDGSEPPNATRTKAVWVTREEGLC